jgi:hypothetical protein
MNKYHVTYYYLATGMEGIADEKDYGIIEAKNCDDAIDIVANKILPVDEMYGPNNSWSSRDFMKGCLSAKIQVEA